MKTIVRLLALAIVTFSFSSCCGLRPCWGSLTAQKEVTTYEESQSTVYTDKSSQVVTNRVPVTRTEKVKLRCFKCGSSFCPKPQCCGIVSKEVLARATTQGGTGEPNIGLIPTMKDLTAGD